MTLDQLIAVLERVRKDIWAAGSLPVEAEVLPGCTEDFRINSFKVVDKMENGELIRVVKLCVGDHQ